MPVGSENDPRRVLFTRSRFLCAPRPMLEWFWDQRAPKAAERVWWHLWDLGAQNDQKPWCSEVPIRVIAEDLRLTKGCVSEAFRWLEDRGVIRRNRQGRRVDNPFRELVALTEVFVPKEVLAQMHAAGFRRRRVADAPRTVLTGTETGRVTTAPTAPSRPPVTRPAQPEVVERAKQRMTAAESGDYARAYLRGTGTMRFADDTQLSPDERAALLDDLERVARAASASIRRHTTPLTPPQPKRRLSPFDLATAAKALRAAAPEASDRLLDELAFAVEEGSLKSVLPIAKALNTGLMLVREQRWKRPDRYQTGWLLRR
jgi:hypothetical protein